MIPEPGARIGDRFVVDGEPIGQGATGVVLPGTDLHTGRRVVLKMLHEHLRGDEQALQRMQAEAGIASRLSHQNVVPVLGLWSSAGSWFLVAEWVDGQALDALADTPLPWESVVAIGLQLASALQAAHRAGIVHGDVRPGNVLLGPRGASLFDFGMAALPSSAARTRPGETAPEVEAGAPPGVGADLYGLGVVLYRALAGSLPFSAPTAWGLIASQRKLPPLPPGPRGVACVVLDLLEPDPGKRPADAATVHRALVRLARRPDRRVAIRGRHFAPVRIGGAWLVHGSDPATGAPALVRADLSRAAARDLVDRLRREGWDVAAAREGLGLRDLSLVTAVAVVGLFAIPLLGAPLGAVATAWLLSRRCRPELRWALPLARAAVPPRRIRGGTEHLVVAGVSMLATAVLLWLWPYLALATGTAAVALLVLGLRVQTRDRLEEATTGRLQTALAEARRLLATSALPVDQALARQGELDALEAEWRSGSDRADDVLVRAEAVIDGLSRAPGAVHGPSVRGVEALRGRLDS